MMKNKLQSGAAVLIFVTLMAILISLILVVAHSRLLLAVRRGQSQADAVIAGYEAESEVSDVIAKVVGGYIDPESFPFTYTDRIGDTDLTVKGRIETEDAFVSQIVTVTASRAFSVSRVEGIRKIISIDEIDSIEIALALDCTGSMNASAGSGSKTRLDAQKEAATSFINNIIDIESIEGQGKFKVGVMTFGGDAKWIENSGKKAVPGAFSLPELKSVVENGFGPTRETSSACNNVMDITSIGSAYAKANEYFAENQKPKTKQIEIVISDGIPNSRIPNAACSPSVFCPAFPKDTSGNDYCQSNEYGWECYNYDSYKNGPYTGDNFNQTAYDTCLPLGKDFLSCALADSDTFVGGINQNGIRNPDVDAYAVTVLETIPTDVRQIFQSYTTENGYFNASRADQLPKILNIIFNEIISKREFFSIKRLLPN